MARRVFFSFHYEHDLWRVNQVRKCGQFIGSAAAGFHDASLWEQAKTEGDAAIGRLIDGGLQGTSVTVVLIGSHTATRRWVRYEIEQSIARGNGLLGIYIHNMKGVNGRTCGRGTPPTALTTANAPCYIWDPLRFGDWVEDAAQRANR